jgi:uncharacterized membrane protein YeaQ/YmgE (transglycosylase-associated protein family)
MDQAVALFTEWAQYFLMWIGFGTLVGLVAKWLLPGKDPGGAFATLVIGIVGTIIGAATFYFFSGLKLKPISPFGFIAALAGTTLILLIYRLLQHRNGLSGAITILNWRRAPARRKATILDE